MKNTAEQNSLLLYRTRLFRCEYKIAFVLPPLIVRYNDAFSLSYSLNGCQDRLFSEGVLLLRPHGVFLNMVDGGSQKCHTGGIRNDKRDIHHPLPVEAGSGREPLQSTRLVLHSSTQSRKMKSIL